MKNFLSLLIAALALNFTLSSPALQNPAMHETSYASSQDGHEDYQPKPAKPSDPKKDPQQSETNPLKDAQFSVTKNLKLKGNDQPQAYFANPKYPPIIAFILTILDFATQIIGSLAVLIMIIGGFMFMTAQGDQTKVDKAKDVIKFAIIGLVITFLSYIIVIFIQSIFITSEQVTTP